MSSTLIELTKDDVSKEKWKELLQVASDDEVATLGKSLLGQDNITHIRVDIYDMWNANFKKED